MVEIDFEEKIFITIKVLHVQQIQSLLVFVYYKCLSTNKFNHSWLNLCTKIYAYISHM